MFLVSIYSQFLKTVLDAARITMYRDDLCRREILQGTASHLVNSVCAYRAGYVAQVSVFCLTSCYD